MSIFFVTLAAIVFVDLLTGVLVGVLLSIAKLLYHFSHLTIRKVAEDKRHKTSLYLRGAATFLSLPKLAQAIEDVPADSELHVHLEDVDYIDHACLDLLDDLGGKQRRASGGNLVIDWGTLGSHVSRPQTLLRAANWLLKTFPLSPSSSKFFRMMTTIWKCPPTVTVTAKGKSADEKAKAAGAMAQTSG